MNHNAAILNSLVLFFAVLIASLHAADMLVAMNGAGPWNATNPTGGTWEPSFAGSIAQCAGLRAGRGPLHRHGRRRRTGGGEEVRRCDADGISATSSRCGRDSRDISRGPRTWSGTTAICSSSVAMTAKCIATTARRASSKPPWRRAIRRAGSPRSRCATGRYSPPSSPRPGYGDSRWTAAQPRVFVEQAGFSPWGIVFDARGALLVERHWRHRKLRRQRQRGAGARRRSHDSDGLGDFARGAAGLLQPRPSERDAVGHRRRDPATPPHRARCRERSGGNRLHHASIYTCGAVRQLRPEAQQYRPRLDADGTTMYNLRADPFTAALSEFGIDTEGGDRAKTQLLREPMRLVFALPDGKQIHSSDLDAKRRLSAGQVGVRFSPCRTWRPIGRCGSKERRCECESPSKGRPPSGSPRPNCTSLSIRGRWAPRSWPSGGARKGLSKPR